MGRERERERKTTGEIGREVELPLKWTFRLLRDSLFARRLPQTWAATETFYNFSRLLLFLKNKSEVCALFSISGESCAVKTG